jgi:hypothetical protein
MGLPSNAFGPLSDWAGRCAWNALCQGGDKIAGQLREQAATMSPGVERDRLIRRPVRPKQLRICRTGSDLQAPTANVGTNGVNIGFFPMTQTIAVLIENSIEIAWDYLERTGALGDPAAAGRILLQSIEAGIFRGERRRLMLANSAITDYQKFLAKREAA